MKQRLTALQVKIPMVAVMTSSLPSDLDRAVGVNARSVDPKTTRILLEAVVTTWEVHRLWDILPTTSRVTGYSEKSVTQKNMESCMFNN
jgi:hypothetical protein